MEQGAGDSAAQGFAGVDGPEKLELGLGFVLLAKELVDLLLGHGPGRFVLVAGGGLGLVGLVLPKVLQVGFQLVEAGLELLRGGLEDNGFGHG